MRPEWRRSAARGRNVLAVSGQNATSSVQHIGANLPESDPVTTETPRILRPSPEQVREFVAESKKLLRSIRAGALATLDAAGNPFTTLVNVATAHDGAPILLMSKLAAHTRNLEARPQASILLAQTGKGDPLANPRLTVSGLLARDGDPALRARFLARHPKSALYADFADFSFWRMTPVGFHLNGGFARAADFEPATILTDLAGADDLVAAEANAVGHLNADHADALRLYAAKLDGQPDARWHATGLDPEGLDLAAGDKTSRIAFPSRIATAGALREILVALARQSRAAGEQSGPEL
ncbi:MAG: HugZ family protein [Rhodoblastus sp.]|nr:HugZ family protein [Rhodoblastus sp.]